jgi:hypothetical protein
VSASLSWRPGRLLVPTRPESSRFVSIHLDSSRFVSIRLFSSRFVSIRLDSSRFVSFRLFSSRSFQIVHIHCRKCNSRFVSIRLDSSLFVSIRLDSSRFVSFRLVSRHTLLFVKNQPARFVSIRLVSSCSLLLEGTLGPRRGMRDRMGLGWGRLAFCIALPAAAPHPSSLLPPGEGSHPLAPTLHLKIATSYGQSNSRYHFLKALLLGCTAAGSWQLNPVTVIPKRYKIRRPGSDKHNGTISRFGGGATFCPTSLRYAYRGKHRPVYLHIMINVISLSLCLSLFLLRVVVV